MDEIGKLIKKNIARGGGHVAGAGFRGGRGKPGYPVPDVLKTEAADTAGIQKALQANAQRLQKKGIKNPTQLKPLGKPGEHGVAYDAGENMVLKITDDGPEASVSYRLAGKDMKHVCKIFDAFKLVGYDFYGILQEKLQPISDVEVAEFNDALVMTGITVWLKQAHGDWEAAKNKTIEFVRSEAKNERPRRVHKELEPQAYMAKANEAYGLLTKKYKLKEIHNELKSLHVEYYDYQGANLMKRGNEFVAADLGGAGAKGGKPPPMLEALFREFGTKTHNADPSWRPENISGKLDDVEKAVEKHAKALEKRGIVVNPDRKLGTGSFGIAYEISYKGRRMALKMTTDPKEARASNHVKGKPTKHIVRIVDVFQLKGTDVYGMVEEKLDQPSEEEKSSFDDLIQYVELVKGGNELVNGDPDGLMEKVKKTFAKKPHLIEDFSEKMEQFQFGDIIKELHKLDVEFLDFHRENIMKRGSTFVIIDLGLSQSPGGPPDVIERVLRGLVEEAKADSVALTIDTFQPPSKGPLAAIRALAGKFTKVIVVIDGKGGTPDQPFSYETRLDMLKRSLPDIQPKVEVYQGTNADLPGTIDRIIKDHNSSIEGDVAFNILVPQEAVQNAKQQVQAAFERKKLGQILFDPSLAKVAPLQGYKDDSKAVLKALQDGDQKAFTVAVDPHLASNPGDLGKLYKRLREELKEVGPVEEHLAEDDPIDEKLTDVGGVAGIQKALEANHDAILHQKQIETSGMTGTGLGTGEDGIAYDMPGGKVLKVTTSDKEAGVSFYLMKKGRGLSNVIEIYDVFKFHVTPGLSAPVWGIEQKKLKPLEGIVKGTAGKISYTPGTEAAAFEEIAGFLTNKDNGMLEVTATKSYDEIVAKAKEILAGRAQSSGPNASAPGFAVTAPQARKGKRTLGSFGNDAAGLIQAMEKYNLDKIIPQLRSLGIHFADFHAGNLLKDGDEYVIADMGGGKHPGNEEPPELKPERIVREIVDSLVEDMGGMGGMGGSVCGMRGGSSAWSSPMDMMTDDDVEDENPEDRMWQKQLTKLQPVGGRKTDVYNK